MVSPRNPLNIGAVARAMANFGFERLTVVAPYAPHWREARSAVGAPGLLKNAKESTTLAEAVAACTLVIGTGTLTHRKPEQRVVPLPALAPQVVAEIRRGGRVALVFGPEKHGLTREDLSWCQLLVEIPTDPRQPSMNLGQAVAVCLYELASGAKAHGQSAGSTYGLKPVPFDESPGHELTPAPCAGRSTHRLKPGPFEEIPNREINAPAAPSGSLDRLAEVIEDVMTAAGYSPRSMQAANRHDLRLLLRRLAPTERDTRRILGLFRRILWRLHQNGKGK
ncbi:MAG: RNA methyltransferase [Terracidiphilus sp.]